MKSIKALAAVALASSLFIGCEEEEHFGIDSSKPAPKEFTYDEDNSSETSISVYWDDASMIEAGATSATVQLTTELNNGDNYDNSVTHTIVYSDEKVKVKNATTFTGLKNSASITSESEPTIQDPYSLTGYISLKTTSLSNLFSATGS